MTLMGSASGQSLLLNFGAQSDPTFNQAGDLLTQFSGVYSGINATLSAANAFPSTNSANNGSVLGDVRVNLRNSNNVDLTISLWDANSGNGFDVAYDPGTSYDWTFVFYDIDGDGSTFRDKVTVYSPGIYTLTDSTYLTTTVNSDSVSFLGGTSSIPGQDGLVTLDANQANAAVSYKITNSPELRFNYNVGNGTGSSHRNLLIDANDLTLAITGTPVPFNPVPEPSSTAIGVLGMTLLCLRRRRNS
jgi:hypothetical protein